MKQEKIKQKHSLKSTLIRYAIAIVVEIGLLFAYFGFVNLFSSTTLVDTYRLLSNGFTVVGLFAFGAGLLTYFATLGAFNFLSFTALKIASKFVHSMPIATMSYGEYVENKKKGDTRFGYLLITGGVLLIVAFIFIGLFYSVYVPPVA